MTETIRCPGCSTRFALRPGRVHPGIRRAKCFRCDTIFEIGDTVDRLLAAGAKEAAEPPAEASTAALRPADHGMKTAPIHVGDHVPHAQPEAGAETAPIRVGEFLPPPQREAGAETAPVRVGEHVPPVPEPEAASIEDFAFPDAPSLTLGDLEGTEEEIMEKTLVLLPPGQEAPDLAAPGLAAPGLAAPELAAPELAAPELAAPELAAPGLAAPGLAAPEPPTLPEPAAGAFSSAKDAIAKLMGDAPAAAHVERRTMPGRTTMDVEATLDALDQTLGGTPIPAAQTPPPPPPTPLATPTLKLTAQEIQAAMASVGSVPPPPPPPRSVLPPPPPPVRPSEAAAAPASDLLKIQMEQETLNNVSIDQVNAWIAQGRIQEYHMVARQFSDHWIEAVKVPALRPAFERKRREDTGRPPEPPPPPPAEVAPPRKGLFGGLFGRN